MNIGAAWPPTVNPQSPHMSSQLQQLGSFSSLLQRASLALHTVFLPHPPLFLGYHGVCFRMSTLRGSWGAEQKPNRLLFLLFAKEQRCHLDPVVQSLASRAHRAGANSVHTYLSPWTSTEGILIPNFLRKAINPPLQRRMPEVQGK